MARQDTNQKIEFPCPHCGKELLVVKEKAGKQGRCPKCGMIIIAPMHSIMKTLEDFDPNTVFQNEKMNELYSDFIEYNINDIIAQKPERTDLFGIETDVLTIALRTEDDRQQILVIGCLPYSYTSQSDETYNYTKLFFLSRVGKLGKHEVSTFILQQLQFSMFSAYIDDDGNILISCIRRLENISLDEFEEIVYGLAYFADQMESKLFKDDNF